MRLRRRSSTARRGACRVGLAVVLTCALVYGVGQPDTTTVEAQAVPGDDVDGTPIPDGGTRPVVIAASPVVSERTEILQAGVAGQVSASIDTFDRTDVQVLAFAEIDDVIYVGGKFTRVEFAAGGSVGQSFLAAFDRDTGAWINSFRPQLDGAVWDLKALPDGKLAIGGQFTNVNGASNTAAFAILDPRDNTVDARRLGIRLTGSTNRPLVRAFDLDGDLLYLGGNFTRLTDNTGTTRNVGQMARIRLSTGRVDGAFLPNIGGIVFDVDADGDRVYVVGNFYEVNNVFNVGLGVLAASNGQLVPNLQPWVRVTSEFDRNYQQAVMVLGDQVWQTGSQHNRQVYRRSDHALLRSWVSDPWGDGQAFAELNGVVYTGSHANGETRLYRDAIRWPQLTGSTGSQPIKWMGAFDPAAREQIPWEPQIGSMNGEGSWELFVDSTDCLWSGGDFNRGSFDGNTPRFVRGFAKFCAADQTPPASPSSPTATFAPGAGSTGVNLAWQASPGDDRPGEVRYEVLKNDRIFASFISTLTFRDPDGTPADRYFVRAMDERGNRSASTRVFTAGQIVDTSRPTTPTGLTATVNGNDVTLTWNASTDNVGVSDYIVYRNNAEIDRVTSATAVVADVAVGDHWYQVRALDAAGNESFKTPPIKVTITSDPGGPADDTTPPSTPRDLAGTISGNTVDLSWTASTDNVGVAEYIVLRTGVEIARVSTASFRVIDVPLGPSWFQVRAVDAAGNESFKTPPLRLDITDAGGGGDGGGDGGGADGGDTTPPSAPRDLAGVINAGSATAFLTWSPSSDNVGVTEYLVLRNGVEVGRTNETTIVTPAQPGGNWYQIRALDAAGNQSVKTAPLRLDL